ncbi:MAG: ATP-binding protein [Candidatus Dormibacteria bacterium]
MSDPDRTLGPTLKRLRLAAGLTQEELAERAGISARTVSDTERGLRSAVHHDTARRLASGLGLSDAQWPSFEAVARATDSRPLAAAPGTGLPSIPTPLLGRSGELDAITSTLLAGDVRLLTLTGPGGIGKTRLAVEAARALADSWRDAVFFVALGEVHDPSLVAPELAKAVGAVESGPALDEVLISRIGARRVLMVLDTFEHLTAAVPLVHTLVRGCPNATFLVTSRSALRLRGEHEFPVPPLASPGGATDVGDDPIAAIGRWPATELFWKGALAVRPQLQLDGDSALLVIDICRKLDGLPLAIELAAARVRHLPLAAVRDQLEQRLDLLVGGAVDLPARQRTISDTVAWSHDLLDAHAQTLFRRLAVFARGWTLEDIAAVCGPESEIGRPLVGVSALVDQNLAQLDSTARDARFEMLDVIRDYAALRLAASDETEDFGRRHALHYLELAEDTEPKLVRLGHAEWFHRLRVERGNLRAGMQWALEHDEAVFALRYTVALWRYWRHRGEFAEGRRWLDAALALSAPVPISLRARALWALGALAFHQGDHVRMEALAGEVLELARQTHEPMDMRNALTVRGMVSMVRGDYAEAVEPFREAVDICRRLGVSWPLGTSYLNFGTALLHTDAVDAAEASLLEGLRVYTQLGDEVFAARCNNTLGHVALQRGDIDAADRLAREALAAAAAQGEPQGIGDGLLTLAAVSAARSDPDRAATLAGAAAAVRETIAARFGPFDVAIPERLLAAAQNDIDAIRWDRSWEGGRALDTDAAVAVALAGVAGGAQPLRGGRQ